MLHEHGEWIEHAECRQWVVPGEDVGYRVVVIVEQHAGVFPAAFHVDTMLEPLEEIAERVEPAAGAEFEFQLLEGLCIASIWVSSSAISVSVAKSAMTGVSVLALLFFGSTAATVPSMARR